MDNCTSSDDESYDTGLTLKTFHQILLDSVEEQEEWDNPNPFCENSDTVEIASMAASFGPGNKRLFSTLDSDDSLVGSMTQEFLEVDDNLVGPMTQEFLEVDDNLVGEPSQAFMEASPLFYNLPLYYQIGTGFENRAGPSSANNDVYVRNAFHGNFNDAVVLEERYRRKNKKYNADQICYKARIDVEKISDDAKVEPLVNLVRALFLEVIRISTVGLRPSDLIRVYLDSPGLDRPISTQLMLVSDLTVEKIMAAVVKVLQSKNEIKLDESLNIDVIVLHREVGAGGGKKILNIEAARLQKTSILAIPYDEEGLCCAKAILYALAHAEDDKKAKEAMRRRDRPALSNRAKSLHEITNIPIGPCRYEEIRKFEDHLNIQVVVISSENLNQVSYKGPERSRRINLWLHNGHYDVIKSLKGFYGRSYYCEECDKPYSNLTDHFCKHACPVCFRKNCEKGQPMRCHECDRLCQSDDCFYAHKAKPGRLEKSLCDKIYQCRECCRVILRRVCSKENHRCYTSKCTSCGKFVIATEHRCYLRTVSAKTPSDLLIFFDFETDQSSGEHVVNLAVAQYANGEEQIFRGYTACENFCMWLFSERHKNYTVIAHNMKGFDGQFIMAWLLNQGIAPEIIPNGAKLMCIILKSLNIKIIDSFNFLPMALARLPDCFGIAEIKKGFFPHLFNTKDNQSYVGTMPEAHYFCPDNMTPSARTSFLTWHKEHEKDIFDFKEEILAYCRSDVDILRRCCLEFRKQFLEVTRVDPFCYTTIASSCIAVYRAIHIKDNSIAMVPVHGYLNSTNYSSDSIRWMDFVAFTENITICHAVNGNGEKKILGVSVDGFCEETNTIYQYHGCFFHGCLECFEGEVLNPLLAVSMATLKEKTRKTTDNFRVHGFQVQEKWEHEFLREKKEDNVLKTFLLTHNCQDRLNPRDAFYGGRTDAIKLYHEGPVKYVDFTSLYPWVNKYCMYPIGHPLIITKDFKDVHEYFGLIKCKVLPPRGLYLPVLPYRCNGKLMFPLCRKCVESQQKDECKHNDEDRSLVGTWVTEEIKEAVKKGYQVTKIFEVYHFEEKSDELFRSYIDLFLKLKQESSGWPSDCITEEERADYILKYKEREGIQLEPSAIAKNPGRRQVAKLALNSFWGRWGMNLNKMKVSYMTSLPSFNKILTDPKKTVTDVYFPTNEIAAVHWNSTKEFLGQDSETNVFIAAFTTAWARLKLYSEMEKLDRAVLYHDTDSIIYSFNGRNNPPLGNFLGEFTDELDGDTITTFITGGAKNYAFVTEKGKATCKIRGFSLNWRNSQHLNFQTMKSLICSMDVTKTIAINDPSKIIRDGKRRKVYNKAETKLYKLVYDKRVVQEDFSTIPYGF